MRVSVSLNPETSLCVRDAEHLDLHVDPAAMGRIEAAQRYVPLRNLLIYLNVSDSLFSTFGSKAWSGREDDPEEPFVFVSRVDLVFLREDANFGSGPHENLGRRLAELLGREPGDALRVELQICRAELGGQGGFCTRVSLYAKGATPEQAELRWGLGLARLQQALLFVARGLRHELGVAG
jgi:hypothetical protein